MTAMFTRILALGILYFAVSTQAATLFSTNATWRFLRGTNEASLPDITAWRAPSFNDAGFASAPAPFWYGDVRPGGTQLNDMLNSYSCIFLRKSFNVPDITGIGGLRFTHFIDDGFVAWLNGREIYRENVTGTTLTTNTLAAGQPVDPAVFTNVIVTLNPGDLVNGDNVLAVQVFNTTLGSSDLGFDLMLESIVSETVPPAVALVNPAPGVLTALTQITVTFSEPVFGLDSDDFLIDGYPSDSVSGSGTNFTFTFAQPPYGPVQIGWRATNGITDLAVPPNAFDQTAPGANWFYTLLDVVPPTVTLLYPPAGVTARTLSQIEVTFSEEVLNLDAADLLINGQPATNVMHVSGGPFVFSFPPATAGAVSVAWAAGHGIVDLAPSPNAFAGGAWSYTIDPNAVAGNLVINEFLANNETGLLDEDGEQQPWIEILNRGTNAVNLANWALSDDDALPGLWSFPARIIAPGEYLVVFASGKDRRPLSGPNRMHTNFKLNGNGEHLGLYSPDSPRVLVHGFSPVFPDQRNDNSYGYDTNGALRYFAPPTPGGPNGVSSIVGVVEQVHFGVSRGFFTQPFSLTLSCPTRGAQVRYTTDGSQPTELAGIPYVQPLRLASNAVIRAVAFRTNCLPSVSVTHTYIFNATAAIRSLPVLSLVTATNNLYGRSGIVGISGGSYDGSGAWFAVTTNDYHNTDKHGVEWERPLSFEMIQPSDNSGFQVNAGVRVHGSDYTRPRYRPTDKFAYRVYFRGAYGPGKLDYPFFPGSAVQKFDQLILRAGHNDVNPFIRDEMTRRLHENLGAVNVHGNLVNLFINGQYIGFFNPTERPDENWVQSWYQSEKSWDVVKQFNSVVNGDLVEYTSFNTYLLGQNVTTPSVYREVARRLDLTNFVDYLCLNVYEGMGDWPANNWVMSRERSTNGVWRYHVWDGEWGCGIYGRAVTRNTFTESGGGPDDGGLASVGSADIARYYQKLYTSAEFRLLFADRIHRNFFNNGALTDTNIILMHESLKQQMLPVLPGYDNAIATTWIPQRRAIIMGHFNLYGLIASSNAPVFNQFGGRVPPGFGLTMAATNGGGTIYFTTNGGDPRVMFTGAVASNAVAYTGPVVLAQTVVVRARTLNGTNWSAVTEANFEVASLGVPLRITEIMYNPAGGSIYEFIELQNIGSTPVDVSGMHFDGINFTFPPNSSLAAGARLVLGSNTDPVSFNARYPGVTVFGRFGGGLNNAGEKIALLDRFGNIITSVDYSSQGGWPAAAAGGGRSLEIIDPYGDPDDPANWHASTAADGSPGAANSVPPANFVRLNEVLAENGGVVNHSGTFPDYVEIQNTSVTPMPLDNWSLTDEGSNPRKFVFPATTIPAGGYLVVWCDDATNTTPGLHTGFTLQRGGDNVQLYNASSNLVDALTFGPQVPGYSVGLVGEWVLTAPTPGAANSPAALGLVSALSINEWQASAPSGQSDWIELYNGSALPVALRGAYLASTSAVHRITSHSFVPPFGFVQLFADEGVGPDRLDFKLPAAGGAIILSDPTAVEIQRVNYTNAVEGLTRGRFPDGTANIVNFPSSASPGASNYLNNYVGAVLNEVLARNQAAVTNAGSVADYVELNNPTASLVDLTGMSLSVNGVTPGQWIFPPGTGIPTGGYLVIWCDGSRPVSTLPGSFNTGRSLEGDSGGVYLFNLAGQIVNSVEYGFQIADRSIGLVGGQWRLLAAPTPGAVNSTAAALGSNSVLRLNEWMASPYSGSDWFEIFNPTTAPVDLGGLYLTDDPSSFGQAEFRIPALSFVGPRGFVQYIADSDSEQGRNHVSFSLDGSGETLRLYGATNGTNFVLIDSVAFSAQTVGVSEGRLPDGQAGIVSFPGSATPSESNYQIAPGIVINEILAHVDGGFPLEDAVEVYNASASPAAIGGWYLSNSQDDFKKFRVTDGTVVPAGGFVVLYQNQFSNATPGSFTFSDAYGGEAWLSQADAGGNLTGLRTGAKFGASEHGVSFGRIITSVGTDYSALSARTFGSDSPSTVEQFRTGTGLPNVAPQVGPIIINEIMYNPLTGAEEYIELQNVSGAPVQLARVDAAFPTTTNTWRISGGVDYSFPVSSPISSAIPAGAYFLVVDFDPGNSTALAAFRGRYGIPVTVRVFGPFSGRLDNSGESISLLKPDATQPVGAPDAGYVPYVRVDRVDYGDTAPWPSGDVDGGGLSLQRKNSSLYGNEPLNWVASAPTPGAANGAGIAPVPVITVSPQSQLALESASVQLAAAAIGSGPIHYNWRFNGSRIDGATNATLTIPYVTLADEGSYDCVASNPGGSALTLGARLTVVVPPTVVIPPINVVTNRGSTAVLTVAARGSAPLRYQWRLNGISIPGQTNATITRPNVQFADDGDYDVLITNPYATTIASARLTVLIPPTITLPPMDINVVTGATFTVSVLADGNPLPFTYEWRIGSAPLVTNTVSTRYNYVTFNAPTNLVTNQTWRVVIKNLANFNPGVSTTFRVSTFVDSDLDGIPDNWETLYGFNPGNAGDRDLDSDGDGMSNRAEYLAGTNPTNAASVLRITIPSAVPAGVTLQFDAVSNRTYSVQFTDILGTAPWAKLGDFPARTNNRVEVIVDSEWKTNRFYRVTTPRLP